MSAQPKTFKPDEFVAKLKSGDLGVGAPLSLLGMVKDAEDDRHLMFAGGTDCETWTEVPLDMIESIELRDVVPCRDHSHPFVKLYLEEPESEEARMFASLAKAQMQAPSGPGAAKRRLPDPNRTSSPFGAWPVAMESKTLAADGGSCASCWEFCRELTTTPDFDDFLWCLNFCGPLCPG